MSNYDITEVKRKYQKKEIIMTKEDFVSLECAKLLKEKGFDEPCNNRYVIPIDGTEREEWDEEECMMCTKTDCEIYPKPTLYEAQKWLRQAHKIHIEILCYNKDTWSFNLYEVTEGLLFESGYDLDEHTTYESALNAGIIEALKMIEV